MRQACRSSRTCGNVASRGRAPSRKLRSKGRWIQDFPDPEGSSQPSEIRVGTAAGPSAEWTRRTGCFRKYATATLPGLCRPMFSTPHPAVVVARDKSRFGLRFRKRKVENVR